MRSYSDIIIRDLGKLKDEIKLYPLDNAIWQSADGISNSAGNLCLHLLGNLNHFIGATLGNTGYIRQRDKEFSLRDIPQAQLLLDIDNTIEMVKSSLEKLSEADFGKEYPLELGDRKDSTGYVLLHLVSHFNYHLGQINYHRRLIAR